MSTSRKLNPFSYVVLTLVGRRGAGPHDLVRMMRSGRLYWTAAASHYYAEPRRLRELGLLSSRTEPGRTRERTHYELTDAGREALAEWVVTPVALPRIQSEPIVRALAADLTDPRDVLDGLQALHGELDEVEAELDAAEGRAGTVAHRERVLLVNHRLARRIIDAHRVWLEEIEEELRAAQET
jgi:DNA-binding PadR family transcriptional regulator